jgi:hypothetical protein
MRYVQWLSAVVFASTLGAVGLVSSPAAAVPCCSAPICQQDEPPPVCARCSPSCFVDDSADEAAVYDEAAGLCYAAE